MDQHLKSLSAQNIKIGCENEKLELTIAEVQQWYSVRMIMIAESL